MPMWRLKWVIFVSLQSSFSSLKTATFNQTPREFRSIDRPEALRSWATDIRLPCLWSATQDFRSPLAGHRVATISGTQQGSCNCCIGVSVPATHYRVHHAFLQRWSVEQLPQCVLEHDDDPALLMQVVGRNRILRIENRLHQGLLDIHLCSPKLDVLVGFQRTLLVGNQLRDCHCEQCVGLEANWVGMRQRRILLCESGCALKVAIPAEDSQGADSHQRSVCLAVRVRFASESC